MSGNNKSYGEKLEQVRGQFNVVVEVSAILYIKLREDLSKGACEPDRKKVQDKASGRTSMG